MQYADTAVTATAKLDVNTLQEFNIEKLHLLEAEKGRVRKEYERREGQIDVKKKIEYSKQLNSSRIKVLQTREDVVHGILDEVGHLKRRCHSFRMHCAPRWRTLLHTASCELAALLIGPRHAVHSC